MAASGATHREVPRTVEIIGNNREMDCLVIENTVTKYGNGENQDECL